MAVADDIDPAQANRRASESLQRAIESLDRHTEALVAPTMEMALVQKKRASEIGLEELEPSSLMRKFVSQAGPGAQIGASEPGRLNPDASTPSKEQDIYDEGIPGSQGRRKVGGIIPQGVSPNASSPIPGMNWGQAASMEEEPIRLPQFGSMQVDAMLKLSAQMAGKVAMGKYRKYASQAGEAGETPSVEGFQEGQGSFAAGNIANLMTKASTASVPIKTAYDRTIHPLLDIGFGASNAGASLGYSPQAGGTFGASHIAGLLNPIAAFTSPAGKQGLGTVVNAAEAAIGGSGIGIGEANSLRQALASQGWSNQRSGGAFGLTVGGNQENIALALEPLVKKGFNSTTSIEQLGEATNALKLGQATPEELKKVLEQLPEAAKTLHKTLEEVTSGMEEFAAKTVEGGGTMIAGMKHYGEISKVTGMNPTIIQGINEGQFGNVQALSKGIMPWEISGMSGNAAALNAWETVKKVSGYVPKQSDTRNFNKVTGKWEVTETKAAKEGGYIHMLEPSVTAEQAERLKEIGPKLEAVQGGLGEASTIQKHRYEMENWNKYHSAAGSNAHQAMADSQGHEARIATLEAEAKKQEKEGYPAMAEQIHDTINEEKNKLKNALQSAGHIAAKSGAMNKGQRGALEKELGGPKGLYTTARSAVQGNQAAEGELTKTEKDPLWKRSGDIAKVLENLNKVNIEKENGENAKIELYGDAKAFFKLKFPSQSAKAESNAGGKSTASQAAQPNSAGETPLNASLQKTSEKAQRNESTVGR
jgi:hypothetical protein